MFEEKIFKQNFQNERQQDVLRQKAFAEGALRSL